MKKKLSHRRHHATAKKLTRHPREERYLVYVRSWIFIVAFALMLGVGALVGEFINQQLNNSTPTVAGASIEAE